MAAAVGERRLQIDRRVSDRTPPSGVEQNFQDGGCSPGTFPPSTLSSNSNPEPGGSGSKSMMISANMPDPPVCRLRRSLKLVMPFLIV